MAENECGDAGAVQGMASELFQLASLMVGDGGHALQVIEKSIAALDVDPCLDTASAREQARAHVVREALSQLAAEQPGAFASQATEAAEYGPCIQDDDLETAGVTSSQVKEWLQQQERSELRQGLRGWLESLPLVERAIFVQRAVLGQGNEAAATLLREAGGAQAGGWTPEGVSRTFRQALCSLANALAHAPSPAAVPA